MNLLGMANKFGRKGLIATFIAASLFSGGGVAAAKDVGIDDAKKITFSKSLSVTEANKRIIDLTDSIAALTDPSNSKLVSTQLKRTAIHESGQLKYIVQTARKGRAPGPARSIFQVEPTTAFDVLDRVAKRDSVLRNALEKSSGKTLKELQGMWEWQMDAALRQNQLFAGVVARGAYNRSGKMIPGSEFPATLEEADDFWMKNYNRSPKKYRTEKQAKFIKDNKLFNESISGKVVLDAHKAKIGSKAGTASSKMAKHVAKISRKLARA